MSVSYDEVEQVLSYVDCYNDISHIWDAFPHEVVIVALFTEIQRLKEALRDDK